MFQEITSTGSISFIIIFIEGLLSFFSPCVIPLIPIYMGYLAGNAKQTDETGSIYYRRSKVFFHTVCFVLGVSAAFFILGFSFTSLGSFFKSNQMLFTRLGGIVILFMGLVQIGFLEVNFLQRERRFGFHMKDRRMNPFLAFFMGFTFSFAWTPCIGPALSSVLILASGSGSHVIGNLLVLLYTAGFIIPFLLLGLFTTQVLNFLKGHQKLLQYTVKLGGILLIVIGIMTFTGWMNGISRYLNSLPSQQKSELNLNDNGSNDNSNNNSNTIPTDQANNRDTTAGDDSKTDKKTPPAYDFTLVDQYGNEHTLSDYKGKVVFLNFWATWCPPCKKELPDIEAIYQEYGKNEGDVIILGVANPSSTQYPNNQDVTKKEIINFLDDNKYTFPVLFDETGEVLSNYNISAFPTTFLIDVNGNVYGYAPGELTKNIMHNVIQQTIDSVSN